MDRRKEKKQFKTSGDGKSLKKKSGKVKLAKDLEDCSFEEESAISLRTGENPTSRQGVVKTHAKEIEDLKTKDPDFFAFLQENDAEMLNFGNAEEDEEDFFEDEVVEDEASNEHEIDDIDSKEICEFEDEVIDGPISVPVTISLLKSIVESSLTGSFSSTKKLISIFKAACIPINDIDGTEEDLGTSYGFSVTTPEVYNEVMVSALETAHKAFRAVLGIAENVDIDGSVLKVHPKWRKVQLLVLSFFKSLLHAVNSLSLSKTEGQVLTFLVDNLECYIPFLFSMPRLSKAVLKVLLNLWAQGSTAEENVRGHAFLRIRQIARMLPGSMREETFRSIYLTFSRVCKSCTESSAGQIYFMLESVTALYSIDPAMAYQQAFLYIRQLALHLRSAILKSSADSVKLISSWQFVNSIKLWTKIISAMPSTSELGELAFPICQIIFGTLSCTTSPYSYPLRFHLISCLQQIASSCQIFVPTASRLLEVLDCPELMGKAAASTEVAPNLKYILKLPTDSISTVVVRDVIVQEVMTLLQHDAEIYRYHVGFPEYIYITIKKLRLFAKKSKVVKWRDISRALINQFEEISDVVKKNRVISRSLNSTEFEQLLPPSISHAYVRLSKLLNARNSADLVPRKAVAVLSDSQAASSEKPKRKREDVPKKVKKSNKTSSNQIPLSLQDAGLDDVVDPMAWSDSD